MSRTTLNLLLLCLMSTATVQAQGVAISAIVPASGPASGGTMVTVVGSGFATLYSPQARIGGSPLLGQVVVDDDHIVGITPARPGAGCTAGGLMDVAVFGLLGSFAMLPDGFAYLPLPASPYGAGTANTPAASLAVNGIGLASGSCGPYLVPLVAGTPLTLAWSGPANVTVALFAGLLRPARWWFGCAGFPDIGTWPYGDVALVWSGTIGATGVLTQGFTVPELPLGFSVAVQGAVFQPSGCPFVLTAAFHLVN